MQTEKHSTTDQATQMQEMEAFGKVIGQELSASRVVASLTGTIETGAVAGISTNDSLSGLTSLYVVARNKASSLSSLTFTIEQVAWVGSAFQVFLVGYISSTPGNPGYAYLPLPSPKTNSTLRVVVSAAHSYPSGADNYTLDVTGF